MNFVQKITLALRPWNKAEITRRTGITQRAMSNWLIGKARPEPASIRALRKIGVRL